MIYFAIQTSGASLFLRPLVATHMELSSLHRLFVLRPEPGAPSCGEDIWPSEEDGEENEEMTEGWSLSSWVVWFVVYLSHIVLVNVGYIGITLIMISLS